jgi:hypothetical protein
VAKSINSGLEPVVKVRVNDMRMHIFRNNAAKVGRIFVAWTLMLLGLAAAKAQSPAQESPWRAEFMDPPMEARPMTWWHWMNGNITKEGITKDLEWMKEFGLSGGGVLVFDLGTRRSPRGCWGRWRSRPRGR